MSPPSPLLDRKQRNDHLARETRLAKKLLEEKPLFLTRFFVIVARHLHRVPPGNLRNRHVPPRLVPWYSLIVGSFNYYHRSAFLFSTANQRFLKLRRCVRSNRPRSQAGSVGGKVHWQKVAPINLAAPVTIIRAHAVVPARAAEPPDTCAAAVIQKHDV